MSKIDDLRTPLIAAALGAALGALAWTGMDGAALIRRGAPPMYALGLVSSYASAAALLALSAAGLGALLARLGWARRAWTRWGQATRPALLTLALGGLAVQGATRLFERLFGAQDVKWIALSLTTPPLTLALWGALRAIGRGRPPLSPRGAALWFIAVGASTIASLAALNQGVFEALHPARLLWPLVLVLTTALSASLWRRSGRALGALTLLLWLALLSMIGGRLTEGQIALSATLKSAPSTHLLRAALHRGSSLSARMKVPATGATCVPGVAPTPLLDMPSVDEAAPDIILMTVDAVRWDHTNLGGYHRRTTPRLARWAKKGVVFSRAYTPATCTRQTFGALFTGVHPSLYEAPPARKWSLSFADNQETMASALSAAGYHTTAIITALRTFSERGNALHGFDAIDKSPHEWWQARDYAAPLQVDRIIAALSDPSIKKPKFVWTHVLETHQSYHQGPEPRRFGKTKMDRYDSAIHFVDGELDRLIRFATSPSRRHQTYLIITADHGHAFKERGKVYHGNNVHVEETHVPLIIWGPSLKPSEVDAPTAVLDLFPTIFDMAGIGGYASFSCGGSLLPAARGEAPSGDEPSEIYLEQIADSSLSSFNAALIRDPYKLMVFPNDGTIALYNIVEDPKEEEDLSQADPARVARLVSAMKRYQREHGIDSSVYFTRTSMPLKESED